MSKKNSAPTVGWVFGSQVYKILAILFIITVLIFAGLWFRITGVIQHDCNNPYVRRMNVAGFWIYVNMGSKKPGCVRPDEP